MRHLSNLYTNSLTCWMSLFKTLLKTSNRLHIPSIVHRNSYRYIHTMKRQIKDQIEFDSTESKIGSLLMEFCHHHNKSIVNENDVLTLRITGGWVRDKLLGDVSHDLDIAINSMSGEEFVTKLTEYLQEFHPDFPLNTVHTIKKNPEKSKHLETCTTKIYDLDIDFVNLRSEKYSTDSRIPIIECGTAEEDALRRDATLNALFYNLNEQKIEDFTHKGLQDLKSGILRTPLTPLQTFVDDPLRVLRLIRFASRFNFIIEDETLKAMTNSEIKSSLLHKISRERVGVELDKILTSVNPEYGLRLLNYVGISDTVFNVGTIEANLNQFNSEDVINEYYALNKQMFSQINTATIVCPKVKSSIASYPKLSSVMNKASQKVFWESLTLIPFKNFWLQISAKRSGLVHAPECVLKEGLRFGKSDFEPVSIVLKHLDETKAIFERLINGQIKRSELGLYLRTFDHFAEFNVLVNCYDEILSSVNGVHEITKPTPNETFELPMSEIPTILSKYEQILKKIEDMELSDVNTMKPLVDGKVISKALNKKPGPWMAQVTHNVLSWQLDNPHGTKEECLEFLQQTLE